jgi:hypothetical protein
MRIRYKKEGDLLVSTRNFYSPKLNTTVSLNINLKSKTFFVLDVDAQSVLGSGSYDGHINLLKKAAKECFMDVCGLEFVAEERTRSSSSLSA